MDITFTIDSKDTILIERIQRVIEHRQIEYRTYETPCIDGCCSSCPYWATANETNTRATRVKFGHCARYEGASVNEDHKWCKWYEQEGRYADRQAG